jgi:MFS family permease
LPLLTESTTEKQRVGVFALNSFLLLGVGALGNLLGGAIMRTLIEPVYAAFAMEQVSDRQRATLSGFYSVTWSIGFSIGPAVGGWLQSNVSLSTSFVFGAFCLLLAPSLLLTFFGKQLLRPREVERQTREE